MAAGPTRVEPPAFARADRFRLYAAAFLRALATGMTGVLIGIYLGRVGLDAAHIGFIVAAGLAGGAAATLFATARGDRIGRRRLLILLALVGIAGTGVFTFASHAWVLGVSAFFGMLNGKPILLFFQTSGYSKSGGLPQWRHLDTTKIRGVRPLDRTFRGGRDLEGHGDHRQWDALFIRARQ